MNELLCPYCNKISELRIFELVTQTFSDGSKITATGYHVYCEHCNSSGPVGKTSEEAIKKYNWRDCSINCIFCGSFEINTNDNKTHLYCGKCYAFGPYNKDNKEKKFSKNKRWI